MFDLLASYRFWLNVIAGNMTIYLAVECYNMAFGAVRDKKLKVDAIFLTFFAIIAIFVFRIFPREMDIPGILSMQHKEVEGTVCDYKKERESTIGHADLTGGTMDVKDSETGKVFRFRDVSVPSDLNIGDTVKMIYLKHYKMGVCVEINGKNYKYYSYNNKPVGIIIIVLLLASMPLYYFWVFRVKPIFDYKKDYSIYVYHDLYIKAMKILYLFMLQTAAILIIAISGNYKTSFDWYWGSIILVDYIGIIYLSFLHQKQFVIIKDKFYYCGFKERAEGSLSEIERSDETDIGIIMYTKEEKMKVLCTSERYKNSLLENLPGKRGKL